VKQGGNTLIPAGVIVMWAGSVASIPAGWVICDGTNSTPNLRDRFIVGAGSSYSPGATGGATTQSATTSSSGSHSHTGSTGLAGSFTPVVSLDIQGAHSHTGGTQSHTLLTSEMPGHTHNVTTLTSAIGTGSTAGLAGGLAASTGPDASDSTGGNGGHSHGITADGNHTHNATANAAPNHSHTVSLDGSHTHSVSFDNRPLFYSLAYIMKS
jgi:microcystin-dependent protein